MNVSLLEIERCTESLVLEAVASLGTQNIDPSYYHSIPLMQQIKNLMQDLKPLVFLLPAFPAKSPSPAKTAGVMPDLGEVVALKRLNDVCEKITSLYSPGARILICSDGRVFSDVVNVSDEVIDLYSQGIQDILQEFKLTHLSLFSMDDLYPELDGPSLRERLLWQFAKSLEEVRHLVRHDDIFNGLFNGIHRFMVEDQKGLTTKSKNQVSKEAKVSTYELLRRSDAWSALLTHYFKDALRFSIHPYPLSHEKFGVKLIETSSNWATPWHNVLVKIKGTYELMHLESALLLGAKRKMFGGKYVYFEV